MNQELESSDKFMLAERGYTIHRLIAEGSFSKVYSASYLSQSAKTSDEFPQNLSVFLVCKLIETESMPRDFVSKYLPRELDILSKISHPHIIYIHSAIQRGSKIMIFMRFAEYGNLCDFLITHGPLREKVARIWLRQLALALMYLHELDIVHRNVKCENILITANHNVKLGDFGFARFTETFKEKQICCMTFCGSLPYAAPEIIRGTPYDPKLSDIWSLGVVLFVMLNKVFPFKSDNLTELWSAQINKNYKFKKQILKVVSPESVIIVSLMLEPNCKKRISLENIVNSRWMAAEPKLLELTHLEKQALIRAKEIKPDIRKMKPKKSSKASEQPLISHASILVERSESDESLTKEEFDYSELEALFNSFDEIEKRVVVEASPITSTQSYIMK